MNVSEFVHSIPATNLRTMQDATTMVDPHIACTGVSAAAINGGATTTNWIDVRDVNAALFRFVHVHGAGTAITFTLEESPDNGTTVFPFPTDSLTVSGAAATLTLTTSTTVTVTIGATGNFEMEIARINADFIRLRNITATGGSSSDKLTVTARLKRFVG